MQLLNMEQAVAVAQVLATLGEFQTFLLDGVTGSGKTEVYLQLTQRVLERGQQTLVLVPEIGLTPQLIERFRQRFNLPIALLHSGLTDRERAQAWRQAQQGKVGWILLWALGVPIPLLLVFYVLRGCTGGAPQLCNS